MLNDNGLRRKDAHDSNVFNQDVCSGDVVGGIPHTALATSIHEIFF